MASRGNEFRGALTAGGIHCIFMARKTMVAIALLAMVKILDAAESPVRFNRILQVPNSSEVVVVSEGEFEPRSSGSYAVRVYSASARNYPLDDFVTGAIRPRRGAVERVWVDGMGRAPRSKS